MPLLNWPPAKGPKPPHLSYKRRLAVPPPGRKDFTFTQPPESAAERRQLIEAVSEFHPIDDGVKAPPFEDKIGGSVFPQAKRKRRLKAETRFRLKHHVATIGTLNLEQAHLLVMGTGFQRRALERKLPAKPLSLEIIYPLNKGVKLKIFPFSMIDVYGDGRKVEGERMSIGYVLWMVAQEYFRIYKHWKRYGVWGHEIGDLIFEGLEVNRGRAQVLVGS